MDWNPENRLPEAFSEIPKQVYQGDPYWIPESRESVELAFSPFNSYFEDGQVYLNVDANNVRLAGFINPRQVIDGKKAAFFGYWETKDNIALNRQIFYDFERWALLNGAEVIYGPINFTTFNNYRIRLNTFDKGHFYGEPYNPDYYMRILAELGYTLYSEYASVITETKREGFEFLTRSHARLKKRFCELYSMQTLSKEFFLKERDQLYDVINNIFSENFAFQPVSKEIFNLLVIDANINRFCPNTSIVVTNKEGEICGLHINFPDYSPLLRRGAKKYRKVTDIDFSIDYEQLENPIVLFKTSGVKEKYRHNGRLYQLIHSESMNRINQQYSQVLFGIMKCGAISHRIALKYPQTEVRSYGLFFKNLV